ncbi:JNK1/MAPK8-associated membrane protein-like [Dendronephthya gigantea]|uniref:JNK1/MAPK8-associated membrane protein-like n=1 Tax=Dendronephthya gigantea TaxID=151771 RepID=UPI00106DC147|nr:JNK1/MAPK8-associated membrane protein-like [Dendronephthya gigantea]XP_028402900.1 JNK1/MAPK8-associated membrane protein-like [Dendronephthya gigantea]XP_028402901.1 JNK1/MAPK8-associated membrane protein-like [Dendronephthya gigantea]
MANEHLTVTVRRGKFCLFLIVLTVTIKNSAGSVRISASDQKCLGQYCGRLNGTECGRCPRGYRTDGYFCRECLNNPTLYDWLYLGFMALVTTLMHYTFNYQYSRTQKHMVIMQISATLESLLSGLFTLLVTEPKGSLLIHTCEVKKLSDWYTVFFNPKPDHVNEIRCTQEAVYPLYSMVLYYYAFCVLLLLVFRPLISMKLCESQGSKCIYAALYFLPITAMIHATCAGLLYYSYPYLLLIGSILSTAILLAMKKIANFKDLLAKKDVIVILIGHWILHAFSLIALTEWSEPSVNGPLFLMVFFPSVFYIMTVKLSSPNKFTGP